MDLTQKLRILADAAKYDASCASSGAAQKDSLRGPGGGRGVGSTGGAGICHSYTPDGRCVSLLKVLLTNICLYDCHYCINRRSSNVTRARFTVDEVVLLTLDFYKRNYIEGLFLSSGIIRNADHTMELVTEVARRLRERHHFRGYIHLKTIPEASQELIEEAGRFADRISINIELPTETGLSRLAPEKNLAKTQEAMGRIRLKIEEVKASSRPPLRQAGNFNFESNFNFNAHSSAAGGVAGARGLSGKPVFATGQSTQMLIGADNSDDAAVLGRADQLYRSYQLKRVYYSGFSPIPEPSKLLPLKPPPLIREHRLYQADWLMRYYEFGVQEITARAASANLDLELDPKLAWALRHREEFPVNLNRAPRHALLRVPGLGVKTVDKLVQARRWHTIRLHDLARLKVSLKKVLPFVETADHRPKLGELESDALRQRFVGRAEQLDLFAGGPPAAEGGPAVTNEF